MTQPMHPIVVGVDGSAPSHAALRYACEEAEVRGLPLSLLHAWQPFPAFAGGTWSAEPFTLSPGEVERMARRVLKHAAAVADACAPDVRHEQHLVKRAPAGALLEASESALMVVVGGRGRAEDESGWVGPVPLRVGARSSCPVIVVPSQPRLTGPVVVGVDGSGTSESALAFAFEEASRRRVPLRAVYAFSRGTAGARLDMHLFGNRREEVLWHLSDALAGWREKYPDVTVEQLVSDEPALRALRSSSPDAALIVVGSHGRGPVLRHGLGSVSSALLRTADCPVAIVGMSVRAPIPV